MADSRDSNPNANPQSDQQAARETAPTPRNEPAPASDVSRAENPGTGAAEGTVAIQIEPPPSVIEPATDKTGVAVIDPTWVNTGFWGPQNEAIHPAIVALRAAFGDAVSGVTFFRDEVTIHVRAESLVEMATLLRDEPSLQYRVLTDLTAVDMLRLRSEPRFDVVVTLYSVPNRQRLRLKAGVGEDQPCPSLTAVYKAAG